MAVSGRHQHQGLLPGEEGSRVIRCQDLDNCRLVTAQLSGRGYRQETKQNSGLQNNWNHGLQLAHLHKRNTLTN